VLCGADQPRSSPSRAAVGARQRFRRILVLNRAETCSPFRPPPLRERGRRTNSLFRILWSITHWSNDFIAKQARGKTIPQISRKQEKTIPTAHFRTDWPGERALKGLQNVESSRWFPPFRVELEGEAGRRFWNAVVSRGFARHASAGPSNARAVTSPWPTVRRALIVSPAASRYGTERLPGPRPRRGREASGICPFPPARLSVGNPQTTHEQSDKLAFPSR